MDLQNLLSRGAMSEILDGGKPQNPVLQILGTKPMSEQQTGVNNDPKYRLMISDGINSHQYCIVSNQDLVRDIKAGNLEKFTIVRLKLYNIVDAEDSARNNKRIIYILNMEVVKPGGEVKCKIGNPVARIEASKPLPQQQDVFTRVENQPPSYNHNSFNQPPATHLNNYNQPPISNPNPYNQQPITNQNPYNQPTQPQPYMFGNNGDEGIPSRPPPSRKENFDMAVIDIASLTPYIGKWTIKGRVLSKSGIKTWSNSKGEGKLFSFEIADKTGGLKVTGFQQECDKFFDYVKVNKVYYLSRAGLKNANKSYTTADYEATLLSDSQLQECVDDREASDMPTQRYSFVSIQSIGTMPVNQTVDLIGILKSIGPTSKIMSRAKNKELTKRNVLIVDMSRHTISVTIWGQAAEEFAGKEEDVFVTKGARISDYGNRTASAGDFIIINPDIPETRKLRNWYSSHIDENFTNLTTSQEAGSYDDLWKPLITAVDKESIRNGAGPCKVKASVLSIGKNPVYKACPTDGCGKKLTDTQQNEMKCEKCQQTFSHCKYRFKTDIVLTDATSQIWATLWDEKAEALFGCKPEEVQRLMMSDNKDQYDKIIQTPYFRSYIFVLRSRLDTYNNEERVRTTVMKLDPLDPVVYGNHLVDDIKSLSAGKIAG